MKIGKPKKWIWGEAKMSDSDTPSFVEDWYSVVGTPESRGKIPRPTCLLRLSNQSFCMLWRETILVKQTYKPISNIQSENQIKRTVKKYHILTMKHYRSVQRLLMKKRKACWQTFLSLTEKSTWLQFVEWWNQFFFFFTAVNISQHSTCALREVSLILWNWFYLFGNYQ